MSYFKCKAHVFLSDTEMVNSAEKYITAYYVLFKAHVFLSDTELVNSAEKYIIAYWYSGLNVKHPFFIGDTEMVNSADKNTIIAHIMQKTFKIIS